MRTNLNKIFISVSLSLAAFFTVGYFSCNRDKCKTLVCANGGVCNSGVCTCASGYEGTECETVSRNKFLGTWNVFEKGSYTPAAQYNCTIKPGTNVTDVVFQNFNNYFDAVYITGYVSGDTLFIYNQQCMGKWVMGIGAITQNATYGQDDYMEFRYEIYDTTTGDVNDYGYNTVKDLSNPSQWNKMD